MATKPHAKVADAAKEGAEWTIPSALDPSPFTEVLSGLYPQSLCGLRGLCVRLHCLNRTVTAGPDERGKTSATSSSPAGR